MTPTLLQRARFRSDAERALRDTFRTLDVLEIHVPTLVPSPGLEPHLRAFRVPAEEAHEVDGYHLHTSPEFAIKATLAELNADVFTLARAYRDEPPGPRHHPEFTMLEWYRLDADYTRLMADTEQLVRAVISASGSDPDPRPFARVTVAGAFQSALGVAPDAPAEALLQALRGAGVDADLTWDWETAFSLAYAECVEPTFKEPTFLVDFPPAMAALARLKPDDPTVAERFELFLPTDGGAVEIANAFSELVDPVEQRTRFEADLSARAHARMPAYPIPEAMLTGLAALRPTAGIALGWERLLQWVAHRHLGWDTQVRDWLVGVELRHAAT